MDETYYTFGKFTFGAGSFGSGPSFDTGAQMEQIMRNTPNQKIYTTVVEYGDVVVKQSPTIVTGDVKISLDGGAFSNLTSTPTTNDVGINVSLSQAETDASKILISFKDQTNPPEWNDKIVNITTLTIDVFNQTSVSAVTDMTPITLRLDDSSYGLSAISNDVNQIPTDNNGIVVSASNVQSDVTISMNNYGVSTSADIIYLSNLINGVASQVLSAGVDGSDTVVTVLEKMLSYATGNIHRINDMFTYYKRDGSTPSFVNSATDYDRIGL